jgi:hypothetical protein
MTKSTIKTIFLSFVLLWGTASQTVFAQRLHTNVQIRQLHSPDVYRPCAFFTLVGVDVADPAVPNLPWFALPQAANGYQEKWALLIAAKFAGKPITVLTNSNETCAGYVVAHAIVAE